MRGNVGLTGLGAMGSGMAKSQRRAGYKVQVCDIRREAADAFAHDGGIACASPVDVAAACEVAFPVVVNAEQTDAVLFGNGDGTSGAAVAMKPGTLWKSLVGAGLRASSAAKAHPPTLLGASCC